MIEFRQTVLDRLDVERFMADQGLTLGATVGPGERRFTCPFHDDHEASANINTRTGLWHCHACDVGGSPLDMVMKRQGVDYKAALKQLADSLGLEMPGRKANGAAAHPRPAAADKLTDENVVKWHEAALRNKELMLWFHEHRGYTDETIAAFQLGWDSRRVTIPVRDEHATLVNVRRYDRSATSVAGKMIGIEAGANFARLFPLPLADGPAIIVEGEWDAILMRQHGFDNALTVTSGAGIWKPEFTPLFADRDVVIAYDNDDAGKRGAVKVARTLSSGGARVRILTIPGLPDKGDVTDFYAEQGRTDDELRTLIDDAGPYLAAPDAMDDSAEAIPVPLHRASKAEYAGKRLAVGVLMSGKAMTPYTVPYKFLVECDMSNKRLCSMCPLQEVGGKREVTLTAKDPAVLSLVNVTSDTQFKALKELAQALPQCPRPTVEVHESINVEELRLIPELDAGEGGGDTEYVSRAGFFLGHGLLPNRGYTMSGYSHPHPKTQATVHLLSEAVPAQDNISAFTLNDELRDRLRATFSTDDVETRWADIYDDFRGSVHRIQGRFDMQVAYDLVWHSVIGFTFNGAFVRRGWVEAMVMGDSGQGKTEMAMELLRHYRLGERVQGEQTSTAGLIGGLEKMGDTWMLSWGRIPLNDKRLLVIDETQGLAAAQVEGMSDVRATGVAEITKIRTERTNARCRIIWLANPVTGLTLAQHNQGVLSIRDLFKKPEDIRRLDFAIAVATGDVDAEKAINVRHGATAEVRYTTELSRSLILWAWSRRPDQIEFTPEATDAILTAATAMGRRYHAAIPLVEPSDQRLKLARLACAAAARVYSTDETGERLVVRPAHVAFVAAFLERIYDHPAMAYGEFSDQQRRGEQLTEGAEEEVRRSIAAWPDRDAAIEFLRTARTFKKSDLTDVVGWPDEDAKAILKVLSQNRLIRTGRDGFVKQPALIALLRAVADGAAFRDAVLLEDPNEPF